MREQCLEEVTALLHDLDEGMLPITVLFPYLPIPAHFKRDRWVAVCALRLVLPYGGVLCRLRPLLPGQN